MVVKRQVVLTLAIGVTVFGGYMYYRFEDSISSEYTGVADEKKAAEVLAGTCINHTTLPVVGRDELAAV